MIILLVIICLDAITTDEDVGLSTETILYLMVAIAVLLLVRPSKNIIIVLFEDMCNGCPR